MKYNKISTKLRLFFQIFPILPNLGYFTKFLRNLIIFEIIWYIKLIHGDYNCSHAINENYDHWYMYKLLFGDIHEDL